MKTGPTLYQEGGRTYLELHAMRAPVGGYRAEYEDDVTRYDQDVAMAIEDFEIDYDVEILTLGRSGRHICIEDTPRNRRRYASLRGLAIQAARDLWAGMRESDTLSITDGESHDS